MSSGSGDLLTSQLRLASARRRVAAFLEQIEELENSSFPHEDGRRALAAIRSSVEIRLNSFNNLPASVDIAVVNMTCVQAMLMVHRYTPVLGFILRSTNVRNAFEVYYPLKRLLLDVLGPDVKLVMSAEWDFEPLTYPLTLPSLPNFVLIGTPASEANNALITPLAGHEMGHSAWRRHELAAQVQPRLVDAINTAYEADPTAKAGLEAGLKSTGQSLQDLRQWCLKYGLRQLEELYCDFIGLYVFGPSYLYAFDYFLAPGGHARSHLYPANPDRAGYVLAAADSLGLTRDPTILGDWEPQTFLAGTLSDWLALTDRAVAQVADQVRALAFDLLQARTVAPPHPDGVARVLAGFGRLEPDAEGASLPEIICAGWTYVRSKGGLSTPKERPELRMLNELILKSVEVSEFKYRTGHAQRS